MSSRVTVISIWIGLLGVCLGAALLFALNKISQALLDTKNV
jgi:hypothetical protein